MTRKRTASFAAAVLGVAALLVQPAHAAPPPPPPADPMGGPGGMMGPGEMGPGGWGAWMMGPGGAHKMMMNPTMLPALIEGKLAFFKTLLEITDQQSGAWNAFADTVRAEAKDLAEAQQKRMQAAGPGERTLPQWVELHLQGMEERVAAVKKIEPALDALYQSLTPAQRQKADQLVRMR